MHAREWSAERLRLLVVDGDLALRVLVSVALEERGFAVTALPSVRRALETLPQVDVVLTGITMDGLSGLDLLRVAAAAYPEVPVVAMGDNAGGALEQARELGAVSVLRIPFSLGQLDGALGEALRRVPVSAR